MNDYLFQRLDYIKNRITGKRISLFLDFDGTLTPIVSMPEKAFLSYRMRELVQRLCGAHKVVIVSGREIEDVKERVGIRECFYVGNQGLEIEGDSISFIVKDAVNIRNVLEGFLREIREAVRESNIRGAVIEDKKLTAGIHYRLLDKRDIEAFLSLTRSTLKPYLEKGIFRVVEGKKVIEVRPNVQWDKGKAVEWLMKQEGFRGGTPIYIGDDETDMEAFEVVKRQGISIAVGPMLRDVDYYLRSQSEVEKLFRWLTTVLSKPLRDGEEIGRGRPLETSIP